MRERTADTTGAGGQARAWVGDPDPRGKGREGRNIE